MKPGIKQRIIKTIAPHLPAVINPEGHLPPFIKRIVLFILRIRYRKKIEDLSVVKILLGPVKGKKMLLNLNPGKGALNTEYLAGYRQEKKDIEILKKLVVKGQTIWDIGIYRGFYSLLFSDMVGTKGIVLAFDIDAKNCRVVNEVSRLNGIMNIKTFNYGISNQNTESEFISSPSSNSRLIGTFRGDYTASHSLIKGEFISKVQLRTLNSLTSELGNADLIKIDIDGAELFALDNADDVFINNDLIFTIESHNEQTDQKITDFLNRNECFVYSINANRFLNRDEIYWGTVVGCKNKARLKNLLS